MLHRTLVGLLFACMLSSCGFQPIYSDRNVSKAASIHIAQIPNRQGQDLRNRLLERINPAGEPRNARYTMQVALSRGHQPLGINTQDRARRGAVFANATVTLKDGQGRTIYNTNFSESVPYETTDTQGYEVSLVPDGAFQRALDLLADKIANDTVRFLAIQ